jgi:glutaredoxin
MRCCATKAWLLQPPPDRTAFARKTIDMNQTISTAASRALPRQFAKGVAVLLAAACSLAQAQQIYRIVGPDGKVSFSDQPPAAAPRSNAGNSAATGSSGNSPDTGSARLPFELSKVARQFPVVLYSGKDCAPCNSGRNLLINRGIPFTERTVENNESIDALRQLSGQGSLPLLTIGTQQLKGYSDTSWTQYLSAAGYPEKSALPSSYQRPSPTPLAEAKAAAPAASAKAKEAASAPDAPAAIPVAPSSGIRF